jgi:hypothetical protein
MKILLYWKALFSLVTWDKTEKVSFTNSLLRKMSNEYEYETFFQNTSLAWHVEFVSYVIFLWSEVCASGTKKSRGTKSCIARPKGMKWTLSFRLPCVLNSSRVFENRKIKCLHHAECIGSWHIMTN